MKGKTYREDGLFYAVVTTPSGWMYYAGEFKSRSSAYRFSVKENEKHKFAECENIDLLMVDVVEV